MTTTITDANTASTLPILEMTRNSRISR